MIYDSSAVFGNRIQDHDFIEKFPHMELSALRYSAVVFNQAVLILGQERPGRGLFLFL